MTCPSTGKPILDLGIYTKNRTFRIPGSCKKAIPKDPIYDPTLPLPTKAFFMDTRMADRGKSLGAIPKPLFLHSATTNQHSPATKKRRRIPWNTHSEIRNEGRQHPQPTMHPKLDTILGKNKKRSKMTPWSLSETKSLPQPPLSTPGPYPANNIEQKTNGNPRIPPLKIIPTSQWPRESHQRKTPIVNCMAHMWRHMCPVSGCLNFGGRGYARSTFINHLNTHCRIFLTNEIERTRALQATTSFGNLSCLASAAS